MEDGYVLKEPYTVTEGGITRTEYSWTNSSSSGVIWTQPGRSLVMWTRLPMRPSPSLHILDGANPVRPSTVSSDGAASRSSRS